MRKNHSKIVCIKLVHLPYLISIYYFSILQGLVAHIAGGTWVEGVWE